MNMSLTDAAERILREQSPGAPMGYRLITDKALESGYITAGGSTPWASMNASINMEIRRREETSRPQRFRAHGKGLYGLASISPLPAAGLVEQNGAVRKRLEELVLEMDPELFEHLVGRLLTSLGFEDVEVTQYHGDKGVDLRATLKVGGVTDVQTAIQAKRWANNVGAPEVRQLRGGLGPHERGLIISSGGFSKGAIVEAAEPNRSPISLVEGEEFFSLLVENRIGVKARTVEILELDEADLNDFDGDIQAGESGSAQYLTVWPLPGGGSRWKVTLDEMLAFVQAEGPSMDEAVSWIIESFDTVESRKTARGYWVVPRSFGLLETSGESLTLTASAVTYLADPTDRVLLGGLISNVVGIDEILDLVAKKPAKNNEILQMLVERCGVTWDTDTQVGYRMQWLSLIAGVVKDGDLWRMG